MVSDVGGGASVVSENMSEREGWHYDSFLIRVWHAPQGPHLHRIELQHLQTGLVEAELDPVREWIVTTIDRLLGHELVDDV